MKRNIIKMAGLAALLLTLGLSSSAQTTGKGKSSSSSKSKTATTTITSDSDDDDHDREQIIIRRKGDKDLKVTVEVKNGEVKVNGKPVSEFKDDNVTITKSKVMVYDGRAIARVPRAAGSPYRSGTSTWTIDNDVLMELHTASNKGFLGVVTEKDNGAKIKEITKGSAAEKAGLKEGDIITKIDEEKIDDPEDLSRAIGNYKPEEKVTVTFLREKKEQKLTVALGKRSADIAFAPDMNFRMPKQDFNFDFGPDNQFYYNYGKSAKPRLGIKAQDTEDGKGVKVLDVQDESLAEKAGIKEGDIITDFNEKPINSADDLVNQAREAKDLNSIKVKLLRAGKAENIEIKIPKKLKTANL